MKVYIFGQNFRGLPDWYYSEHEMHRPHRVKVSNGNVLMFEAEPVKFGNIGYIFGTLALLTAIRKHNLFFRQSAAKAEAARRWQERFGG